MLGCQPHGNFIVFYNGFIGCQCLLVCLSQISKAEVPPITQNKLSRKTSSQLFAGHLVLLYKWNLPLKVTSVSLPFASHTFQLCHFPCPGCEMSTFDAVKPGKKNRAMILVVHHARIPWPINVPSTSTNFLSFWLVFNFVYINCSLDPPLPCEVLSLHPLFVQARVEDPFGDKTRFSGDRILAKAPAIATSTTRLKLWKEVASLHPK